MSIRLPVNPGALSKETSEPDIRSTPQVTPQVAQLLRVFDREMDRERLQAKLGLTARKNFRLLYLKPALQEGLIEKTIPDKPNSRLQKYRLTDLGRKSVDNPGEKE